MQQGAGAESTVGAWTPVLQYKTPKDGQDTPAQEEMLTTQVADMLSSSMKLCDVHTAMEAGNLWYVLGNGGEPLMAYVVPEKEQTHWLNVCAQTGMCTRNAGPDDEEAQAFDVVDLSETRYSALVSQVCTHPEVLQMYADLGQIAEERESPESRKVATALQNVADSNDKTFLTKVVILSRNWIDAPAELQAVINNWAFDVIFKEVVEMMTMELGVQRDQQDRFKEIQEYLSAEFTKRYGNTRHPKRLKELLRSALEAELVPLAHSVGQQLNEPMVVLKTLGNGHCLEAAISWILYKTAGMAKELVRVLLELYRDPEFADLFQLGLATCQAQGGDLQHVTQESFLAGLKAGSIW